MNSNSHAKSKNEMGVRSEAVQGGGSKVDWFSPSFWPLVFYKKDTQKLLKEV